MVDSVHGQYAVTDVVRSNSLNAKLNPICHLLTFLELTLFLRVSRIRVKARSSALKGGLELGLGLSHGSVRSDAV
jgi:hypothetical protein